MTRQRILDPLKKILIAAGMMVLSFSLVILALTFGSPWGGLIILANAGLIGFNLIVIYRCVRAIDRELLDPVECRRVDR